MKRLLAVLMAVSLLAGCSGNGAGQSSSQERGGSSSSQSTPSGVDGVETLPEMTAENQGYAQRYLEPLAYSGFFWREYSGDPAQLGIQLDGEGNVVGGDLLIYLFEDSFTPEEREELYAQHPDGVYPQEVVEEPLIAHFGWTAEQIRTQLADQYDAQAGTYLYIGGRGGGPVYPIVIGSSWSGDILTLTYEIYGMGGGPDLDQYLRNMQGELTIQVEGERYVYRSNHPTWTRSYE